MHNFFCRQTRLPEKIFKKNTYTIIWIWAMRLCQKLIAWLIQHDEFCFCIRTCWLLVPRTYILIQIDNYMVYLYRVLHVEWKSFRWIKKVRNVEFIYMIIANKIIKYHLCKILFIFLDTLNNKETHQKL